MLYRYGRNGKARFVDVGIVVEDSPDGLALWIPSGAPKISTCPASGGQLKDIKLEERFTIPALRELGVWRGPGVLRLVPPDRDWSISWFFHENGTFSRWYGTLEAPRVRWETAEPDPVYGIDTADRILDILITPDRTTAWKDEDELRAVVEQGLCSAVEARQIRLRARELASTAQLGLPPFDGRWTDFRPDPAWATPDLPPVWDIPHHHTAGL
ncbi:DUF402 domain-containing protein [Nonomuraea longicatena]|uniref:DUF402 domain-containing protein n=1 Tax=Nonomuraea longicatena TaxID=83682 RepID=A0ABN1QRL3_9ACTN